MCKNLHKFTGKVLLDSEENLIEICTVASSSSIIEITDKSGVSTMSQISNADLDILVTKYPLATEDIVNKRLHSA